MELRAQRTLDPGADLVVRPESIAKRFDHMVGGDSDMREAGFAASRSWEHGLQYTDDGTAGTIVAFVKPAQPVEVTKEFVGAVDDVDDHETHLP